MTRSSKRLIITAAAAMTAAGIGLLPVAERVCLGASADSQGVAVVINTERAPDAELPRIEDLRADPGGIAQALTDAQLRVTLHPTGRCIAATAPPLITDEDLRTGHLSPIVLAAGILERTTSEQFAARFQGYVTVEKLSETQQAAAQRIGRRRGLVDEEGRVTEEGTHLCVGIWCRWEPHVVTVRNGDRICRKLKFGIRPPTEPVVAGSPLSGSVLWWAWPHAEASWGNERVSVEAGTYTLDDLLARLSAVSEVDIVARSPASETKLTVVASQVCVKELLWAIEIATGLPARTVPDSEPPIIAVGPRGERAEAHYREHNVLVPISGLGYYSASDSPGGRELLSAYEGGPTAEGQHWIGWRFSDLPLLYRNWVQEEWERSYKPSDDEPLDQLKPDETYVLWVKCVLISITGRAKDGGGRGGKYLVPAF